MATTTQILSNSPALHSLKRDQLVRLCKIHHIKANGKNSELIERLKQRALELPPEELNQSEDVTPEEDDRMEDVQDIPGGMPVDAEPAPVPDTATNGDDYDMQDVVLTSRFSIPRPSEQWEVVMEDIEELDETMGTASSKNSLRTVSNGEFGTHMSKSSVSSSIKALATSLGIKRVASKASHHTHTTDSANNTINSPSKMPSFSPGKLLGVGGGNSTRARDSLAEHAIPYDHIPPSDSLPETDHFKFSTPDSSILGLDADADDGDNDNDSDANGDAKSTARSSVRLGPAGVRSTIRLVSHPAAVKSARGDDYAFSYNMSPPKLPVVKTDFDIVAGTPGTVRTLNVWPATPRSVAPSVEGEGRLYPKLPLDEDGGEGMPGGMHVAAATPAKPIMTSTSQGKGTSTPGPVDQPDMFSPSKRTTSPVADDSAAPTPARGTSVPRSAPFLFGSPLPRRPSPVKKGKDTAKGENGEATAAAGVSNAAFDGIAKSVLEEMHRRLAEANKDKPASSSNQTAQPLFTLTSTTAGTAEMQDRFAKVHEAEFSKMDSIATHYAARRLAKRKSDALGRGASGRPSAGQKRRSSAAGARVISAGARRNKNKIAVPGGFGADDEDDEEQEDEDGKEEGEGEEEDDAGARRSSKRMRITEGWDVHRAGQRVSLAPPLPPAEEERKMREREAVKRELNAAKARRRSSRGRPSIGAPQAKAKSRFGFLGAAKSLVRNVWNMGGGSKAKAAPANPPPSSIPVPKASQTPAVATADKKGENGKANAAHMPSKVPGTSSVAFATNARKASGSQANQLLKPPPPATDAKNSATITSTKSGSSRSRSPIPSFNVTVPSGTIRSTATAASRPSSIAGTARSRVSDTNAGNGTATSRQTARTSTVSSMGTRTSVTSGSTAVSSMGTRRSFASTNTLASTRSKADAKSPEMKDQPSLRKRTSSLLAPTASSLAKTIGRTSGLPSVAEAQKEKPKRTSVAQVSSSSKAAITSPQSHSPSSPRPTRIFSQPLTNFASSPAPSVSPASPVYHPSLTSAAAAIMGDAVSSPSKIPRPAVIPPKPKQLVARKPRISRSKVIAKLGAQRAAAAQGSSLGSPSAKGARTRSSMGARRSFGGVKPGRASAGSEIMRSAVKKRARQSEYIRRKSRVTSENDSVAGED
ncbi:hypothetical protein DICSQDRAFT_181703 [Dichomitus squalens LYAD-421 SS1]|uniref:SAP domain-containing protein n=1 Tax=Dichomitus squalens (strain LYAD-421) TaxID=732165 RepID=R7SUP1_DICSQ|nr:uncharacterized protein DICSQDRAFT_181703 [Dichomitus squalens LYAD-421 SS1]EJF59944.1 hypothetical protein DICSQDRAFT_181703 [Dichomitus squalens LYAD-421 SS1]